VSKTVFLRCCLPVIGCFAAMTASAGPAYDVTPGTGQRVAKALVEAQIASDHADSTSLARALGVIERAGAHPLDGWTGTDPVPEWRSLVPAAGSPLRGSPLGPGYRLGQVSAGQSESFEQVFLSGRKASVSIATPDGKPVSLRVTDGDKRIVCQSGQGSPACNWVPLFTQRYRIEVRNGGQQKANYFLVVD
jgi:hypothetical protein